MTSALDVVIPASAIGALAAVAPRPFGPLSPFFGLTPARDDAALGAAGFVTASGEQPEGRTALATLAHPEAVAGFLYTRGPLTREAAVYHGAAGAASMTSTRSGLRLQSPAALRPLIDGFAALMAGSTIRAVPLDADLTFVEAVALLAVIDLHRRAAFARLAGVATAPIRVDANAIARWLADDASRTTQWLAAHLVVTMNASVPDLARLDAALRTLAGLGLLRESGPGLAAGEVVEALARWLPVVGSVLRVSAGRLAADGTPVRVELRAVFGSPDPILVWQPHGGERVHLRCASGAELVSLVRPLLEDARALASFVDGPAANGGPTQVPAPSANATKRFCSNCGAPRSAGARFCGSCGQPMPS